jgi:hypothetical protein
MSPYLALIFIILTPQCGPTPKYLVLVAVILLWAVVKQRKVIHTAGAESSQSPKNV